MFEGARAVILALHERKPGVPIILQSLLPIVDEPKDVQLVQPVNKRLRALAESEPFAGYVSFLDLYPSFVDSSGKQISRYFNDGIHPSLEGYRVWRDQLAPFLEQARGVPATGPGHFPSSPRRAIVTRFAEAVIHTPCRQLPNSGDHMQIKLLTLALGAVLAMPTSVMAAGQTGIDNANGNASFLRCGTKHPSEMEQLLREEHFLKMKAANANRGKPGGGGGGGGGVPVRRRRGQRLFPRDHQRHRAGAPSDQRDQPRR